MLIRSTEIFICAYSQRQQTKDVSHFPNSLVETMDFGPMLPPR